jgi:sec-independent protein translocase protein TatA
MGSIGFPELVVILLVALVLFGANRIPEIGRAMGAAINEFKKGMAGEGEAPPAPRGRRGGRKPGKRAA